MVDPGQVYDTIQLNVAVGGTFQQAEGAIQGLINKLTELGNKVTPIRIDTRQIDAAIDKLTALSRGIVPPAAAAPVYAKPLGVEGAPTIRGGPYSPARFDPRIAFRQREAIRAFQEQELRRFEAMAKTPGAYGTQARMATLGAMRGPARAEMEAQGIPYKLGAVSGVAPAATENIKKMNDAMADTVDKATKINTVMPGVPTTISATTVTLKDAVPAAEAMAVKLDAVKLSGGDMKPVLAEAATAQKNLKTALAQATTELPKNSAEVKRANAALKGLNTRLDESKGKTSAYTLTWKNMTAVMGKVAFWAIATGSIYGMIRAFKSMVDIIIKVDHAMADIRKVYQGAPSDIKPLRDDLINLTVALGGNVEQVMEAAVGWARLGYKRREIASLMRTTMLAMNIAELGAAEATELLTAAMQQFEIPAGAAITVLDSWNELSNRTLATTRDLGDAVSIAGATFSQTGDSIHYLNAITATLVQTMAKSGREVGTAMRTIGTYIYRPKTIKGIKEIAGVEVTKGPTKVRAPGETDIEYTRRLKDNMKSQSQVLGELAGKWDTLTERQQINLAQQVAGVRRYNYFMALMKNYDLVIKNLIISIDSVGSAERENAIYMDTLQKTTERLRDSFVKLYVAGGDAGLSGILKIIMDTLRKLVDGFSNVNLRVVAVTAAAIILRKTMIKLALGIFNALRHIKTFGRNLAATISPAAAANVGIMALGAAFTFLASRAEHAKAALDRAIQKLNEVTGEMERSEEAVRNAANNLDLLGEAHDALLAKVRAQGGKFTEEQFNLYKQIEEARSKAIGIVAEETGYTDKFIESAYKEGQVREFVGATIRHNNIDLEEQRRQIKALAEEMDEAKARGEVTLDKIAEWGGRFAAITGQPLSDFGIKLDTASEALWDYTKSWEGVGRWALGVVQPMTTVAFTADVMAEGAVKSFGRLSSGIKEYDKNIKSVLQERYNTQIQNLTESFDDIAESVDGAGKEVDQLQLLIDAINREIAPFRERTEEANFALEQHHKKMAALEETYGEAVTQLPNYIAMQIQEKGMTAELASAYETLYTALDKGQNKIIELGPNYTDTLEKQDKFNDAVRQLGRDMRTTEGDITDTTIALDNWGDKIEFAESAISRLAKQGQRNRDALEMVLPSRHDAKAFADDLRYSVEDLNEIVDNMNKARALAGETRITYFETSDILQLINADETEIAKILTEHNMLATDNAVLKEKQLEIIEAIGAAEEIVRGEAERINQEYYELSNTFQNILDEGLYGIIMGEQTALDLAKELGQEYARIALQTVTQPATERFAQGMAGVATFMKTGRFGPSGGIMDVKLEDGKVPVRDEELAAAVGAMATATQTGAAKGGLASLGMGPVAPGAQAGGGMPTWLGPMMGGVISGGVMGAGGGAGGSAFGATMGAIGGIVSTLGPWGAIAGAGISMLGLLGNLFGGKKYEEEDPYARQQAAGMGERSVNIGTAGTVMNYIYITMYYESSFDRRDAERMYDAIEEVGQARGYQIEGNASPTTV